MAGNFVQLLLKSFSFRNVASDPENPDNFSVTRLRGGSDFTDDVPARFGEYPPFVDRQKFSGNNTLKSFSCCSDIVGVEQRGKGPAYPSLPAPSCDCFKCGIQGSNDTFGGNGENDIPCCFDEVAILFFGFPKCGFKCFSFRNILPGTVHFEDLTHGVQNNFAARKQGPCRSIREND